MERIVIVILERLIAPYLVWGYRDYRIHSLIFVDKTDEEARQEIAEWSWQDRAEWLQFIPFRTYRGWTLDDIKEYERMLWPGVEIDFK